MKSDRVSTMQVISYSEGIAKIEMAVSDLKDITFIVENAEALEPELLDGVKGDGLPMIEGPVLDQILSALNSAKLVPSANTAVLEADKPLAIYLATILIGAASRGEYVDFPREDGTLIDTERKASLGHQLKLIKMGFNPEEMIQKLEERCGVSIPRFKE